MNNKIEYILCAAYKFKEGYRTPRMEEIKAKDGTMIEEKKSFLYSEDIYINTFKKITEMRRIRDIIIGLICTPIGLTLFVCVSALATVLWIPYFIWLIIRTLFFSGTDDDFIGFIFICYGLGVTCLIAPFGIIESGINI